MKFEEYRKYDAVGLADLVATKQVTGAELLNTAIERLEVVNPKINAVIHTFYDKAKGNISNEGAFAGVPFLIKDLELQYKDEPMQCGSRSMKGYISEKDSVVVQRVKKAGFSIFGKTSTPEFGLTPYTEPNLFGAAKNPWNLNHTPGGSSGGSAAAVAAGVLPLASASDGGGSIRIPAACCGLFGLKPSRGIVTQGPFVGEAWGGAVSNLCVSRSVRDTAAYLDVVKGHSKGDMYYVQLPITPYKEGMLANPGKLKIGFSTRHPFEEQQVHEENKRAVMHTVELLRSLGHEVEEVPLPYGPEALTKYLFYMIVGEVAAELEHVSHLRGKKKPDIDDFEVTTYLIGELGKNFSAKQYAQAKRGWYQLSRQMADFHDTYDLFLTPTLSRPPVRIGELKTKPFEESFLKMAAQTGIVGMLKNSSIVDTLAHRAYDYLPFTPLANMTGQPSMNVPLFWGEGNLPIGTMLTGRMCEDTLLLQVARQLEEAQPWFNNVPEL